MAVVSFKESYKKTYGSHIDLGSGPELGEGGSSISLDNGELQNVSVVDTETEVTRERVAEILATEGETGLRKRVPTAALLKLGIDVQ